MSSPWQIPSLAPNGTSTMHCDSFSSDSTPIAGPQNGGLLDIAVIDIDKVCPTILGGGDIDLESGAVDGSIGKGGLWVLATNFEVQPRKRTPVALLFDPKSFDENSTPLAEFELSKGEVLGGIYCYLDSENRLVVMDGENKLKFLKWNFDFKTSRYLISVDKEVDFSSYIDPEEDNSAGLIVDIDGIIWVVTVNAKVLRFDFGSGEILTIQLNDFSLDEQVKNSISWSPAGLAVVTTYGMYVINSNVEVLWSSAYNRGIGRKPGQLSWGSGASPTFFGESSSYKYLTIVDNAYGSEGDGDRIDRANLLIYDSYSGEILVEQPLFNEGQSCGTENSIVAVNNKLYVTNTYGYVYPVQVEDPSISDPYSSSVDFNGGIQCFEVIEDAVGRFESLNELWNKPYRSTTVPKLCTNTETPYLYTFCRSDGSDPDRPTNGNDGNTYFYTTIDPTTGDMLEFEHIDDPLGRKFDTWQMVGVINEGILWQGWRRGLIRVKHQ